MTPNLRIEPLRNPDALFSDKWASVNAVYDAIPTDRHARPDEIAATEGWPPGFVKLRCQHFYSEGYVTRQTADQSIDHGEFAYRRQTDRDLQHLRGFRVVG